MTIVLTPAPDAGHKLYKLTVKKDSGAEVELTENADGTFSFTMPAEKVTAQATFIVDFEDVHDSDYFSHPVDWAVSMGITNGVSATLFAPNATCTRAQAVTFLWRAAGSPEPAGSKMMFTDVAQGTYYYKAVLWAIEQGITNGTSATTFSPDMDCNRGHIVTFLLRSQKANAASTNNPFHDVAEQDYFYKAVLWAAEQGITTGTTATTFSPANDCTRGQIVTFLYRSFAK